MGKRGKLFVVGWHKTATTSISRALDSLGIACWHFPYQLYPNLSKGVLDFRLLASWSAAADMPIPLVYRDLHRFFPNAKFILTVRETGAWLQSVKRMFEIGNTPRERLGDRSFWDVETETKYTHFIHEAAYGTRMFDQALFTERFERHNRDVRRYFRPWPNQFLELDVSGGLAWQPLCEFVKCAEPKNAFPRLNVGNLAPWVVDGVVIDPTE